MRSAFLEPSSIHGWRASGSASPSRESPREAIARYVRRFHSPPTMA